MGNSQKNLDANNNGVSALTEDATLPNVGIWFKADDFYSVWCLEHMSHVVLIFVYPTE